MHDEVSASQLKQAVGKKVEVLAFGITYVGILKKVDDHGGTIRIEDKGDYAVLEIERIEAFKIIGR